MPTARKAKATRRGSIRIGASSRPPEVGDVRSLLVVGVTVGMPILVGMDRLAVLADLAGLALARVVAMGRATRDAAGVRDGALGIVRVPMPVLGGEGGSPEARQQASGEKGGDGTLHDDGLQGSAAAATASTPEIATLFDTRTPGS
jgi:hypothetical protein